MIVSEKTVHVAIKGVDAMTNWSKEYEIGHEQIDNQHQEIFQLTSMLDGVIDGVIDIEDVVKFLEKHIVEHFQEENELMVSIGYSEKDDHLREHEIFVGCVKSIRHTHDQNLLFTRVLFEIRLFIDKLIHHIKTVDIKLAEAKHRANTSQGN
jgi:hemerythrin